MLLSLHCGCKVNQYETNAMAQKLMEAGYKLVEHHEKADIYIVNTCTVTNMSDRKSRQMLRKMKEQNEKAILVAVGCYAQVAKQELEQMEEIDLVLGNDEKVEIVKYIEEHQREKQKKNIELTDVMYQKEYADFGQITFTEKTRAVIKVQDGCDRFCSYCIIPYARGRVRSRKPTNIVEEIKQIAQKGIQEVVITGIHIASYGKDFQEEYGLIDLLEAINSIEGIQRIRLGSIEPLWITEEMIQRLKKLEKICHHFHLSLQSGCDETLQRMNRRYDTKQFRKIVDILRNAYSDVILTTDIIVGFPEETDQEFEQTYQFLKEINFYKMHIFKYSPRKGTKAASMKSQITGEIKEKRSKRLMDLSDQNQKQYHEKILGQEVEILWEEKKGNVYQGHSKNYILFAYETEEHLESKMTRVRARQAKIGYILV